MVKWQITATTIYCDGVEDEVTLMVSKDWSVKCTGCQKYGVPGEEGPGLLKKRSRQLSRRLECEGSECCRVIEYKEKLLAEETEEEL